MPKKTVFFNLDQAVLTYDDAKNPIKTASNGVHYMDVPGLGFYVGEHKGFAYDVRHIEQLAANFEAPTDELYGSIPVMVDHSMSNHDKIGHLRSVVANGGNSETVYRIIGDEAIQAVREGKYRSTSAAISMSWDPDDDEDDDEDEVEDDEDFLDPDEDEEEDEESWADYCKNFNVSYVHMAFTPFPALAASRIYRKKDNSMSDKPVKEKSPIQIAREKALEEAQTYAKSLESDLAAERASREHAEGKAKAAEEKATEAILAARKYSIEAKCDEFIRAGKRTPAQKGFECAFMASLDDDQLALYESSVNAGPAVIPMGIAGAVDTIKPEDQNPLSFSQERSKEERAARAQELLLKYSRTGSHAQLREEAMAQSRLDSARAILEAK